MSLKIFIKNRFQIIHGANPPDHIFLIAAFFKLFGTKYIFDQHDLCPELYLARFSKQKDIFYKILILSEKLSCMIADVIVSTNESFKQIITRRHSINSQKIL